MQPLNYNEEIMYYDDMEMLTIPKKGDTGRVHKSINLLMIFKDNMSSPLN